MTTRDFLLQHRSGLGRSEFGRDNQLQVISAARFHAWIAKAKDSRLTLRNPPAGEYGYDADLWTEVLEKLEQLRIEYKWDRHTTGNLAAEIIAIDRGPTAALGYLFKQTYDWLAYSFVQWDVMYLFDAQAARKYVLSRWKDPAFRFGAAHTPNNNGPQSSAWSLLVPVNPMLKVHAAHGVGFRLQLPRGLLNLKLNVSLAAIEELPNNDELRQAAIEVLLRLPAAPRFKCWVPSERVHWDGLLDALQTRAKLMTQYSPEAVAGTEINTYPWEAVARENGWLRD